MTARLVVLVPAAGGGSRFGAALPKQYADLAGRPMLMRTLDRLASALPLTSVAVALSPDDDRYEEVGSAHTGLHVLRCGGATRAATVANALSVLAPRLADDDWVLVHDAARPCVPAEALRRLVAELADDPVGGVLAIPVADTLKRATASPDDAPRVLRTEDRAGLWQAQTPQMFRCGVLRAALALPGALDVTDEAAAIEALAATGACASPRLVMGSALNVKVTYAADLALAVAILAMQEKDG